MSVSRVFRALQHYTREDVLFDYPDKPSAKWISAVEKGDLDYVDGYFITGYNYYDEAMVIAAAHGHLNIVNLFKDLGITNYDKAMIAAAANNNIAIATMFKIWGATQYSSAIIATNNKAMIHVLNSWIQEELAPEKELDEKILVD